MTAAVIGFIGVIAGALVTGWLNHRAEKDRRRAEARVAAQLIAAELENAVIELESSIEENKWWTGELLTKKWEDHASALAMEAERGLLESLADAYAQLEDWDRERKRAKSPKPSLELSKELETNQAQFKSLAEQLKEVVEPTSGRGSDLIAVAVKSFAILATLIVVGALAYAAFVPRAETTDSSIATALERELPGEEIVYCSHDADRWHCNVAYPTTPRSTCRRVAEPNFRHVSLQTGPASGNGPCGKSSTAWLPTAYKVTVGDEGPVASPRAGQTARRKRTERIWTRTSKLSLEKTSFVNRAVSWFEGE